MHWFPQRRFLDPSKCCICVHSSLQHGKAHVFLTTCFSPTFLCLSCRFRCASFYHEYVNFLLPYRQCAQRVRLESMKTSDSSLLDPCTVSIDFLRLMIVFRARVFKYLGSAFSLYFEMSTRPTTSVFMEALDHLLRSITTIEL